MYRCELSKSIDKDRGIEIDADLMKSIGVRKDGLCWAVLIDGRRSDASKLNDQNDSDPQYDSKHGQNHGIPVLYSVNAGEKFDRQAQGPHAIVSPVIYDHWLSSARLSVIIEDRPGALEDLLKIIASRANIELFELAPIGYRHSEVRLVVNFPHFSRWTRKRMRQLEEQIARSTLTAVDRDKDHHRRANEEREKAFKEIGEMINAILSALIAEIILADAAAVVNDPAKAILSSRFMKLSTSPWFTDISRVTQVKRLLNELCTEGKVSLKDFSDQSRREFSRIFRDLDSLLSDKDPYKAQQFDQMYIRTKGSGLGVDIASESMVWSRHYRWREQFFARTWRDAWTPAIRTAPLSHLAYARIWSFRGSAMQMVYTGGSGLSCVDIKGKAVGVQSLVKQWHQANEEIHRYEEKGIPEIERPQDPEYCHAVVDSDGLWMRLRFLQAGFAHMYGFRIEIEFYIISLDDESRADVNAQGILADIVKKVSSSGMDIRMGYNNTRELSDSRRVAITLFVVVNNSMVERAEAQQSGGETARMLIKDEIQAIVEQGIEDYTIKHKHSRRIRPPHVDAYEWDPAQEASSLGHDPQ